MRVASFNQTHEILNVSRKLSVMQPEPASDSRLCRLFGLGVLFYVKALGKKVKNQNMGRNSVIRLFIQQLSLDNYTIATWWLNFKALILNSCLFSFWRPIFAAKIDLPRGTSSLRQMWEEDLPALDEEAHGQIPRPQHAGSLPKMQLQVSGWGGRHLSQKA